MLTSASASDAFSMPIADGDAAEIVREIDDGLAQRRIDLVGAAVGDEDAVELELGERQFLKPRQRGIAAAEIVDRQMDVEVAQLLRDLGRQRQIGDDLLFRHVDDQARPFFELGAIGLHDVGHRDLDQRFDRNIDREPQIDAELGEVERSPLAPCASACSDNVIRPDSVAPGMNALGISMPCCGWRARANASAPTSCFLRRSIFG